MMGNRRGAAALGVAGVLAFAAFAFCGIAARCMAEPIPILPEGDVFRYAFDPAEHSRWQVFTGGVEVTAIGISNGAAGKGGAYVFDAENGSPVGFGSRSSNGNKWIWGCSFSNATQRSVRNVRLRLGAGQWGCTGFNKTNDFLAAHWLISRNAADISCDGEWHPIGAPFFVPSVTAPCAQINFPVLAPAMEIPVARILKPDERLLVRFTDYSPKTGGNAAMGIWLFELECDIPPLGFAVGVR